LLMGSRGLLKALLNFDDRLFRGDGGVAPRARKRAPRTELGVTAAAPKAKTTQHESGDKDDDGED